jgi:hypothetical protein
MRSSGPGFEIESVSAVFLSGGCGCGFFPRFTPLRSSLVPCCRDRMVFPPGRFYRLFAFPEGIRRLPGVLTDGGWLLRFKGKGLAFLSGGLVSRGRVPVCTSERMRARKMGCPLTFRPEWLRFECGFQTQPWVKPVPLIAFMARGPLSRWPESPEPWRSNARH